MSPELELLRAITKDGWFALYRLTPQSQMMTTLTEPPPGILTKDLPKLIWQLKKAGLLERSKLQGQRTSPTESIARGFTVYRLSSKGESLLEAAAKDL